MVKMFEYKVCRSHRNRKLDLQINSAAKIWNLCIRIHRTYYHLFGKFLSKNELQKILVRLKNKGYFPFLKDIGSQAVQNITDRMDRAYKDWFKNLRNGKKKGQDLPIQVIHTQTSGMGNQRRRKNHHHQQKEIQISQVAQS